MKTLVTGGSGYLGTHLREYFAADDLSRRSGLDVLDPDDAAIAGDYDLVIHLAAHLDKSPDAEKRVFATNVEGTINVLRAMKRDAIFIFASTKDVYGRFADNYRTVPETCETLYSGQSALEWSKLIAERYVEFYAHKLGFRASVFRLSTVYAPDTFGNLPGFVGHYLNTINHGDPLALPGGGRPVRDLLYVDDLAAACMAFAESIIRQGLYNLGGGPANAVSLRDLVARIEEVTGLQAVIDDSAVLPAPSPLNYVSDLSRVTQELDWEPTTSIDEGLRKLFEHTDREDS